MSEQQACGCLRCSIGTHRLVRRNFYRQIGYPRTSTGLHEIRRPQDEHRQSRRSGLHQNRLRQSGRHQSRLHRRRRGPMSAQ
jgi:hypothetical protein